MAGFDDLLNFVFRAVNVTPRYEPELCIVVSRSSRTACSACYDACPHDAVRITSRVELDPVDCTGCGLCVRACPSGALETSTAYAGGVGMRCSQVAGNAQSVQCLAKLAPTDLLRLAGAGGKARLARGDCDNCKIGSAQVPAAVDRAADEAKALARVQGRELEISVSRTDRLDEHEPGERLSRRQLLGGGVRGVKQAASDALAPLERILPAPEVAARHADLPTEHGKKLAVLAAARPAPDELVPYRLPRVADGCIMCPLCTKACPTDAISRDLSGEAGVLKIDPQRCVGCDACVPACPVGVISMDDSVTWGELRAGPYDAYVASPERRATGSVHR